MPRTRHPAVAGRFYPSRPGELAADVDRRLASAPAPGEAVPQPKAVIVPHGLYTHSGSVAAASFAQVARRRAEVSRVVLMGPSHRVSLEGLAVPTVDEFVTPLGSVLLDRERLTRVLDLPQVTLSDAPHQVEHSLEVQLPFLQRVLGFFQLLPFAVGRASGEDVAQVLDRLWGGPETLIVVSSDLSHDHGYTTACRQDAATRRAIEQLRPAWLGPETACGHVAVAGLLIAAERHRLQVHTLDLRNSGDTAGPREEVVGYGAWALG